MLLSDVEVAEMLSVSRNTVWRWAREVEDFPQPYKIGGASRWRKEDVFKFVDGLSGQTDVEDYIQQVAK